MSDEFHQIILADTAASVAEEPPRRRGIFGLKRRSKLPEKPLTHCENCGAPLNGEFCSQCGQHAIDYRRSIFRVLLDAADSFLNWDTKFLHSVNQLLVHPWRLTNDFNAGRRARYVHPLRLYLIASIIFFLLARAINWDSVEAPIQLTAQDRTELVSSLTKMIEPNSPLTDEQRAQVELARTKLSEAQGALTVEERDAVRKAFKAYIKSEVRKTMSTEERAKMAMTMARIPKIPDVNMKVPQPPVPSPPDATVDKTPADFPTVPPVLPKVKPKSTAHSHINFGPEDDAKKTPFELWMQKQIKEKIGEDGSRGKLFFDTLRSNIPGMMLCCIPLFALVLKILYIRQGRYYVEHLVYALHIHTFFYVAIIILSLAVMAANRTVPVLSGWITAIFTIALVVQVFLSIRRVYGQNWFMTLLKFLFGGFVYLMILVFGVAATAIVTLLMPS